ncbi:helix-turn-helix domain-containing protein [Candidatus Enterococcus palustris]|uniref:helix-turn-helix domain-containing protein n=1 Tax=Candidatus Enterococcus palustris TaxID=1834189 RepID=UPI00201D9395|nr:helix-turn-helix domain-containing protein [Enterococcus sp. 7F3_DIV0205]
MDIKNNDNLKNILLEKRIGGFLIQNNSEHNTNYLSIRLRLNYLEHSLQFKILLELLLNHYNSVEDLAEKLYVSPSHLYKNITALNVELKRFPLKIIFHPTTNFQGKEKYIRMLNFYFFWSTYRGITWTFDFDNMNRFSASVDFAELKRNYSESVIKRLEFMVGLFMVRQEKHPIRLPKKIRELSRNFSTTNDISQLIEPFLASEDEILFFNLISRCYISEIDDLNDQIRLYNSFPRTLPLIKDCDLLVDEYEKYFYPNSSMGKKQKAIVFYYSLIGLIQATYFSISPFQFFRAAFNQDKKNSLSIKKNPKVYKFYEHFRKNNPDFSVAPSFDFGMCVLLTILTETFLFPSVSVYIQYSRNNLGMVYLKNRLHTIFNPETLHITNKIDDAELIITDCFESGAVQKNQKVFYISNAYDELTWFELFSCIQNFLFKPE